MSIPMIDRATIYTRSGATGAWSVVARTDLHCRLGERDLSSSAAGGSQRAEQPGVRRFWWDPAYVMPDRAQIEVNGVRWNIVHGTTVAPRLGTAIVYRGADVVKVQAA